MSRAKGTSPNLPSRIRRHFVAARGPQDQAALCLHDEKSFGSETDNSAAVSHHLATCRSKLMGGWYNFWGRDISIQE